MTIRVGNNSIGRNYPPAALERNAGGPGDTVEVVAVNAIAPTATAAHLLKYDSTYGRLNRSVAHNEASIAVDGHRIAVSAERDPASCVVDPALTRTNGELVKVLGWYDNEWGCCDRLLDLTSYVAGKL
ncbi:hypothetical protein GCM10010349_18320 [Streptomyces flavofungini]|uniref:Glyceraldehyde 3-phosphate dehydrogenase NAD(P) binding domain-containing protein n=1 Tax=Streptomyces flavofungini TaxID=68200 RepID=A0ABS0XFA7_9ACTN|nr:hypothetical protein [Streptomyces flavofungini]GHC52608.1 hypothetical protein GCM10010349_18320 [Streptomyces flavofungini]